MDYIAVDWGSTNFRATRVRDGVVVSSVNSNCGITLFEKSQLSTILLDEVKKLGADYSEEVPVVMCGMIGSNLGIEDVGYYKLPVSISTLGRLGKQISTPLNNPVYIQSGIACDTTYDVCRGEELQILGALQKHRSNFYVAVGTHSKWISLDNDYTKIESMTTVMTGELYNLLLKNSLIGKDLPEQQFSNDVFKLGMFAAIEAKNDGRDIIIELFKCRSRYILGQFDKKYTESFVSGLLITHEVLAMYKSGNLCLIGSNLLLELYSIVCDFLNIEFSTISSEEAVVLGFNEVCRYE